ncbi:MAG: hypothetical protein GY898_11310 [Proteobacteria bacterium]|nr:hypothetical protein [Pseudomonadota bacterium]
MLKRTSAAVVISVLMACGDPVPDPVPVPVPVPEEQHTAAETPAATPEPTPDPAADLARDILREVVSREAADPANAWALAHGILAWGQEFRASDGRLAVEVLATDFLEADISFAKTRGDVRVEPHTDLILKTLVEAGVPLDEPMAEGKPTLRALLQTSQGRFDPALPTPNDSPWSIQAYCQAGAEWEGTEGASRALLAKVEEETMFIRRAVAAGETIQKRKQDIFAYTCGGAHLIGGATACAGVGWPKQGNTQARVDALIDLYLARVPVETRLVDESIQAYPQLAPILHNQDIKFLGHLIEVLSKAQRDGLWTPNDAEDLILRNAEARLLAQVIMLKQAGVYEPAAMDQLASDPETFQFYLDLVGDACHAFNGLRIRAAL